MFIAAAVTLGVVWSRKSQPPPTTERAEPPAKAPKPAKPKLTPPPPTTDEPTPPPDTHATLMDAATESMRRVTTALNAVTNTDVDTLRDATDVYKTEIEVLHQLGARLEALGRATPAQRRTVDRNEKAAIAATAALPKALQRVIDAHQDRTNTDFESFTAMSSEYGREMIEFGKVAQRLIY